MSPDPQSSKVDERRWTLNRSHPITTSLDDPKLALGESVEVVPASLVDELRERLLVAELDASLARSELDAAVASETQILRHERDALRAEVERLTAAREDDFRAHETLTGLLHTRATRADADALTIRALEAERHEAKDGGGPLQARARELEGLVRDSFDSSMARALLDRAHAEGARQERERVRAWADELRAGLSNARLVDPREFGVSWVLAELAAVLSTEGGAS